MRARLIASLAIAVARLARAQRCADIAWPLPDAALPTAEPEGRQLHLGDREARQVFPRAADQFAVGDVLAQVLLDLAAHDLPEAAGVLFDGEYHGCIPEDKI